MAIILVAKRAAQWPTTTTRALISRSADQFPVVVVQGLPGSGKTSLAESLAQSLCLPLLSKDTIKQVLEKHLPQPAAGNEIGKASQQVLYALVAYAYSGAVLDSFFHASFVSELQAIGPRLVQVYCRCPYEVARQRYEERARRDPTRHGDRERGEQDWQLWLKEGGRPLPLESPLLEVDTTLPVDADEVAQWVRDRSSREW